MHLKYNKLSPFDGQKKGPDTRASSCRKLQSSWLDWRYFNCSDSYFQLKSWSWVAAKPSVRIGLFSNMLDWICNQTKVFIEKTRIWPPFILLFFVNSFKTLRTGRPILHLSSKIAWSLMRSNWCSDTMLNLTVAVRCWFKVFSAVSDKRSEPEQNLITAFFCTYGFA